MLSIREILYIKGYKMRLIYSLIFLTFSFKVFAQQDPMYTKYMFNKLVINPAYAGSKDRASAIMLYRAQWTGFEGAPKTAAFSIHSPLSGEASKVGLGLSIVNDIIGISNDTEITGHYAYRTKLGRGRLSMGLSAQIKRRQMDWTNTNPTIQDDPSIPFVDTDIFLPNFGVGFYYDTDYFFASLSAPRLLQNKLDFNGNSVSFTSEARQKRHYYGMLGGIFQVNPDILFKPSILAKFEPASPFELDINMSVLFYETFWLGGTWRSGDSFDVIVHFFIKDMRIGYAHDFTLTRLNAHHNGSHEIMIGFDLKKKKRGLDHPRYF